MESWEPCLRNKIEMYLKFYCGFFLEPCGEHILRTIPAVVPSEGTRGKLNKEQLKRKRRGSARVHLREKTVRRDNFKSTHSAGAVRASAYGVLTGLSRGDYRSMARAPESGARVRAPRSRGKANKPISSAD